MEDEDFEFEDETVEDDGEGSVLDEYEEDFEADEEEGQGASATAGDEDGGEAGDEEAEEDGLQDDQSEAGELSGPLTDAELAKLGDRPVILKMDGEEVEIPLKKIVAGYRKGETAEKRFQEAAELRREVVQRESRLIDKANRQADVLKKMLDPQSLEEAFSMFSGGKEALMSFVETKIEELIEESQMSPEQLELKHYRRQVEQMNRRQQEAQKAQEEARRQQAAMQQQETFARALETELKNHNIPADTRYRRDVDRFVDERLMHVVREQQRRLAPSDLQMAVEAAAEYFGPLLAAERTAKQEAAKAKRAAKPKAPPMPKRGAPRKGKAPKAPKMDTRTYFEKIAEEAGEW